MLDKLRKQLTGKQPEAKKVRIRKKASTGFRRGDVAVYRLNKKIAVRFCVSSLLKEGGDRYAELCLLGLDDGKPFLKSSVAIPEFSGPFLVMWSREPEDGVTLLRRGVAIVRKASL